MSSSGIVFVDVGCPRLAARQRPPRLRPPLLRLRPPPLRFRGLLGAPLLQLSGPLRAVAFGGAAQPILQCPVVVLAGPVPPVFTADLSPGLTRLAQR